MILGSFVRNTDIAGRYGGEEFIIFLPQTPPVEAVEISERIKEKIEKTLFIDSPSTTPLTISIGIACYPQDISETEENPDTLLLKRADQALYKAKELGRNRVATYSDPTPQATS